MSDNVRKKWRLLKKNRFADANASEQNLRSRTIPTNNKNNETPSNNNNPVDNEANSPDRNTHVLLDRQTSSSPDHIEDNLNDATVCNLSKKEKFNQRYSNSSSPPLLNNNHTLNKRYDCDKCNLVIFNLLFITQIDIKVK
jgi:hypothetical protein